MDSGGSQALDIVQNGLDMTPHGIKLGVMQVKTQKSFIRAITANKKFRSRLEFIGGTSRKFYEIVHSGAGKFSIRWGRIGGKASRKQVGTSHVIAKLANKLGKGYVFCAA